MSHKTASHKKKKAHYRAQSFALFTVLSRSLNETVLPLVHDTAV